MCRRWSSSVCSLLVWLCLTACNGSDPDNGVPAAGGGGGSAQDPDSGTPYRGDAGPADAAQGGAGGMAGSTSAGEGGSGGGAASDVEPAECRPDPSDFTPCGGDVTGKWRIASICFDEGLEDLREQRGCPELTQEFSSEYRMVVDFMSSGNYSAALDAKAVQLVFLPFSCLPEERDCRALGDDDRDDSDGQTLLVTTTDQGCSIEAREHRALTEEGTWRVSGSELTRTNATGTDTSEYCVAGNTLISRNVNEVTGAVSWGVFERL